MIVGGNGSAAAIIGVFECESSTTSYNFEANVCEFHKATDHTS